MNILVACEESQRVCIAFREKGHNTFSCDLQPCSGGHPEWHIQSDVLPLLNGNCTFTTCDTIVHHISGTWDLLIAHPPCTYLSKVSANRLFNKDHSIKDYSRLQNGKEAAEFFMHFYNANCSKICIENPVPMKIWGLPDYTMIIQPYEFGHFESKATCLWLKGLPYLMPTTYPPARADVIPMSGVNGWGNKSGDKRRSVLRSKTFEGIAKAMAQQWG